MRVIGCIIALIAFTATGVPSENSPLFPYENGWLGADAAYSIPLTRSSTIWLFGDTFVGKKREADTMIHNSIAIRTCHSADCQVTYWWSGMHTQPASSFFRTKETDYFWPLDGFTYRGKLYIFLEQMHSTGGGGAFGFDYSGVMLATVSNPFSSPSQWRTTYKTILRGNKIIPGIATVVPSNQIGTRYVYVFTLLRRSTGSAFCILMRLRLDDLAKDDQAAGWQSLTADSKWKVWMPSTVPSDALKLLAGNITEMSVAFRKDAAKWLAVFPTPTFLSNTASFSTATQLEGPWTEHKTLFPYPEMKKGDPRYTPHVFCYAAKEHPELEINDSLAVTYACNSTKEKEILRDNRLYRPELTRLYRTRNMTRSNGLPNWRAVGK